MPAKNIEELIALCKRRGFIFQSSEIYGGTQGLYDYGPLGGELKNIHKSAANEFLIKQAQWFNIDVEVASKAMKDVYKNYKKYIENSRKQTKWLKENYSAEKMTEILKGYMDSVKPVTNVPLNLPKLKKTGGNNAPQIPELKLPKLKKAEV